MAITISIAGIDVTTHVDLTSVKTTESPTQHLFEMDFNLVTIDGDIAAPENGNEVVFSNASGILFAGQVLTAKGTQLSPGVISYAVQATDYTRQFGRHLVVQAFQGMTADAVVKWMVTNVVNPGLPAVEQFTTNNVHAAPVVADRKVDHLSPTDVMQEIADETGWTWWIDYERDIHFLPWDETASPVDGGVLDADNDTSGAIGALELTTDGTQIKNRVFLEGFTVISTNSVTDHFTGDGVTTTFLLTQVPASLQWSTPVVTVGGVAYVPATDIAAGFPGQTPPGYECYFNSMNMTIRFSTAPASGVAIVATYYYTYKPVVMMEDPQAQAVMKAADGGDGTYEYDVNDSRLSSVDTTLAEAVGQLLLFKYAYPLIKGTFTSFLQGWAVGQAFTLKASQWFGGIDQTFWVVEVRKKIVNAKGGTSTLQYSLDIASRPFVF